MLSPEKRFDYFTEKSSLPEACWLWKGATVKGYGKFNVNKKTVLATHYAYERFKGPIGDKFVLHKCDTPLCVNPEHLFLGTHTENMKDMVQKGRDRFFGRPVSCGPRRSSGRIRNRVPKTHLPGFSYSHDGSRYWFKSLCGRVTKDIPHKGTPETVTCTVCRWKQEFNAQKATNESK